MVFPTQSGASGIWTLKDQRTFKLGDQWPLTQSYQVSANVTTLYEGNAVYLGITTIAVANGTPLYWTIPQEYVTAEDFVEGVLEGIAVVHRNNSNIILTAVRVGDQGTPYEGPEPFYVQLRLDSNVGDIVAVSPIITIEETPGYVANANITAIAEGNAVVFTIDTTNIPDGTTLYWTNNGTTDSTDFVGAINNGTFVVNGSTANVTLTLENNPEYEGAESIVFQVRTSGFSGSIVATAPTVTVTDYPATYSIEPNVISINEGPNAVLYSIVTTNVPNGTTLYWTQEGTADVNDIDLGASGSVIVHNLTSNLLLKSTFDEVTDGIEYSNIVLRTGSTGGPIVATANSVTIFDTSWTPIYTVTPNVTTLSEGSSIEFSITTTNVVPGTYYWTNSGTTIAYDFMDLTNSGTIIISGTYLSGSNTYIKQIRPDFVTEGGETLIFNLRTGSTSGPIVATAETVLVNDTSVETYNATPSTLSVDEGNAVIINVVTQGVPDGTTLYWTNAGTTNAADFTGGQNSGNFNISSNAGSIVLTCSNDQTTEGSETLIIEIRTTGTGGPIQNTTALVTVNDTSRTPLYAIAPNVVYPVEGNSIVWTVTTANVDVPVTLYWTNSGNVVAADFTQGAVSGTVSVTGTYASGSGNITLFPITTDTLEVSESVILQLRTGSTAGPIVATSDGVFVTDAPAYYIVSPSTTSISEGQSVTYTITTYNPPSTTLYWTTSGTTVASDFSDSAVSGSFSVSGTTGTVTRTTTNNAAVEGSETIIFEVRTGSTAGPIVATASTVTLTDAAGTYSVSPSTSSVNEGSTVTWTISTTNVSDTTLYWTNGGTTVAADFSAAVNSGSFSLVSNSGTVSLTLNNDVLLEGSETIIMQIRTGSTSGPIVATSSTVTVADTSFPPPTPTSVCYMLIGGGGGGSLGQCGLGAGGGAGGIRFGTIPVGAGTYIAFGGGGDQMNQSSGNRPLTCRYSCFSGPAGNTGCVGGGGKGGGPQNWTTPACPPANPPGGESAPCGGGGGGSANSPNVPCSNAVGTGGAPFYPGAAGTLNVTGGGGGTTGCAAAPLGGAGCNASEINGCWYAGGGPGRNSSANPSYPNGGYPNCYGSGSQGNWPAPTDQRFTGTAPSGSGMVLIRYPVGCNAGIACANYNSTIASTICTSTDATYRYYCFFGCLGAITWP